jgi:hypothetical protein
MAFLTPSVPSTQEHLEIEDIREDFVILKNGSISLVLEVNAINFDLLSEREQDVKILSFAAFLNSLDFPIQVVIKTERTDISEYIEKLNAYKSRQISNALRKQIEIYVKFISNLTLNKEVLDKKFYVVIPEIVGEVQRTSLVKQVFGRKTRITNVRGLMEKAKPRLYPKRDHIIKQFKRINLVARQLLNDELIRLYYSMYDPDKTGISKLQLSANEFTSSIIKAKT